jgi:hypothetical protein
VFGVVVGGGEGAKFERAEEDIRFNFRAPGIFGRFVGRSDVDVQLAFFVFESSWAFF